MSKSQIIWEIFWRFLSLGCICFGGPTAHLAYFQRYFVERLSWLNTDSYAKLVALSQFLPGPGSSQLGFAIGLQRAGLAGGIAAFIGFTLPSFCIMLSLASYMLWSSNSFWLTGIEHGLKLLAVIVIADAVFNMAKQFCRSILSWLVAISSALLLLNLHMFYMQITLILAAAIMGVFCHRYFTMPKAPLEKFKSAKHPIAVIALFLFTLLFLISFTTNQSSTLNAHPLAATAAQFYQSGSLVFGGGHVVLPLLQQNVGESLSSGQFLSGYAAAQGVPGPMFSLAAYLGVLLNPSLPITGALIATIALFLPGLLLMFALYQQWVRLASHSRVAGASSAINAAVVGILFSAWVNPVVTSAVTHTGDLAATIVGFILLRILRFPLVSLVFIFICYGIASH